MRLLIVSDAWFPQVNGVVRTIATLADTLERFGHTAIVLTPDRFRTFPCPSYPEIRLAVPQLGQIGRTIDQIAPDAVHIATEGPLGLIARRACLKRGRPFSTSFHTMFPEYINARWAVPVGLTYGWLRRFHAAASSVMVATKSLEDRLRARGFENLRRWTRGVDLTLFRPRSKSFLSYPRPISLYVGRVAVEKNIDDFLCLPLKGTKVVVGRGPQLDELRRRYPQVVFVGEKFGEELARHYAAADVFVFPSRTDTFGLVVIEALACGVPVAAYPVAGPRDIIDSSDAGSLHQNLGEAVRRALLIPRERCRAHAKQFSWEKSTRQFLANIHPSASIVD